MSDSRKNMIKLEFSSSNIQYLTRNENEQMMMYSIVYNVYRKIPSLINSNLRFENSIYHNNNIVNFTSFIDIEKFAKENNLIYGDVENLDDLNNINCIFPFSNILNSQKGIEFLEKKKINEIKNTTSTRNLENYIMFHLSSLCDENQSIVKCCECKCILSTTLLEKNKHLFDCLMKKNLSNNNNESNNHVTKKNRRKGSKVMRSKKY